MSPIFTALLNNLLGPVLERILPDPAKRMEAQLELARMAQAGEFKELESQLERERIAIERTRAESEDRVSARDRERAVKDRTPAVLSAAIVGGFFVTLFVVIFFGVAMEVKDLVLVLLGSLGAGVNTVLAYYFGSSSGSATKQATFDRLAEAAATTPHQNIQVTPARDVTVESPST